jgi:hypothetical protein
MKVYIDMDGVLADFDGSCKERRDLNGDPPEMFREGFFRNLKPMPGAKWAIKILLQWQELDLQIATKPTTKTDYCASEKIGWLREHFPELVRKVNIVHDKLNLTGDFLIDDDHRWMGHSGFIFFRRDNPANEWFSLVTMFAKLTGRSIQTQKFLDEWKEALASESKSAPHTA